MNRNNSGFVRITGGKFRGRKIRTPGGKTHPMGERERLAIFNILNLRIENGFDGVGVIDLFSGGGTLGIEALSRGALFALMMEKDKNAVKTAEDNLAELGISKKQAKVVNKDIYKLRYINKTSPYRVVFADPPYDEYDTEKIKKLAWLIPPGGFLVLSHPGEAPEIEGMELFDTRKYASAYISFYSRTRAFCDFS